MKRALLLAVVLAHALFACEHNELAGSDDSTPEGAGTVAVGDGLPAVGPPPAGTAVAIFAGGCFWCMEPPFDALPGVVSTTAGYTGGRLAQPSYAQVSSGRTGHVEAIRVVYRPEEVSYEALLDTFWRNVDPLDDGGQFCDRGSQYRSAIFATDPAQREAALASKRALEASGHLPGPIVTTIRDAGPFYPAEDYHQEYYEKNPLRYKLYRRGCGRDARLGELWGAEHKTE